jgi:hypothetical protein
MVPATKPSGKRHRSPGLDADVDGIHAHNDITALRFCRRTAPLKVGQSLDTDIGGGEVYVEATAPAAGRT